MGSTSEPIYHRIVALESRFCDIPTLDLPEPHSYTIMIYPKTTVSEIPSRIKEAESFLSLRYHSMHKSSPNCVLQICE